MRLFLPVALLLMPAQALATRSAMVFIQAGDRAAAAAAPKLASCVENAVGRDDRYQLTRLRTAAGDPVSPDARAARRLAEDDLAAGEQAFADGKLDVAEEKLRLAIRKLEVAASALERPDAYADAHGMLAAVLQQRGKEDDARDEGAKAFTVDPGWMPKGKLGAPAFSDLMKSVRKDTGQAHRGAAMVNTTPEGAKVFVDGELKGYTPLSIDHLLVGRHLLRFERAGFFDGGQVLDISSIEDGSVRFSFQPTRDLAEASDLIRDAAQEVSDGAAGPSTWRLLAHYKLDRAVIGVLHTNGDSLVLDLALVDAQSKRRVSHRRNSFEGDEYGDLDRAVGKLTAGLLDDADRRRGVAKKAPRDPLDAVSGMEDWSDEAGSGSASAPKSPNADDADRPAPKSPGDEW